MSREYKQSKTICAHKIQEDVKYVGLERRYQKNIICFCLLVRNRRKVIKHRKVDNYRNDVSIKVI